MDQHQDRIKKISNEIRSLHPRVMRTIDALKDKDVQENSHVSAVNVFTSPTYLRLLAFSEGMVKISLMIEENFISVNTFGVLATTRYVLELLIWYRLLMKDVQTYACYYEAQLIADQLDHNKAHLDKVNAEIELFENLGKQEREARSEAQATFFQASMDAASLEPHSVAKALNMSLDMVSEEIDRSARRNFSLYLEQAKRNGFDFQAYLMKKQAVPKFEHIVEEIRILRDTAKEQMPTWPNKKWYWKEEAKNAGLSEQFDFIYGYTSRLLHARPVSFNTNQKNLEANEIAMFLDFVYVSMLEAIEISEQLVGLTDPSGH